MRFERVNPNFAQAVLLTIGALAVLMPLMALTGEKPVLADDKQAALTATATPVPAVSPNADFTKAGVSKVDAILILRQAGERRK